MSLDTVYIGGATNKIIKVRALIISTGLPYTLGAFNTAGLAVHYTRDGAVQQTITQVTAVSGTYTSSGFVHCGDGVYEIGAPAAALLAGVDGVVFTCSGIADVVFSSTRIDLMGVDPRSATAPDVNVVTVATDAINANALATDAVTEIVTGIFAKTFPHYNTKDFATMIEAILALLGGVTTGANTATETFKDGAGNTRVVVTNDNANRLTITLS